MYLIFNAVNIARPIARRDHHYLVSPPGKIRRKVARHLWHASNHRGVLIGDDHDTHSCRSLLALQETRRGGTTVLPGQGQAHRCIARAGARPAPTLYDKTTVTPRSRVGAGLAPALVISQLAPALIPALICLRVLLFVGARLRRSRGGRGGRSSFFCFLGLFSACSSNFRDRLFGVGDEFEPLWQRNIIRV